MSLFANQAIDPKKLFFQLYNAKTEDDVAEIINKNPNIFKQSNWHPLGDNESNYGVIENQQSSPIAALVEKVTNSVDATLMKKCLEAGIDPKSDAAPRTVEDAIKQFFPDHKQWDLNKFRRAQAENIQIVADGTPRNTSVIIYDNGEGQHPQDFPDTFLSLLRGNKNEIHFVQGKYNMGGSGAIVFSGKQGYQLIASKRYDNKGDFGFTLIREHPLSEKEQGNRKNTWYEYLTDNGKILSFKIEELDLRLHNRKFRTGTVIKLYSYQFPSGYSGFAQDLNQSLNEFLFEPALPIYTVDKKERYPNNNVLELDLFGLKRRLEESGNDFVDKMFSEVYEQKDLFGSMKVTCYVFKSKLKDRDAKETKEVIRKRFFKNNMSVLFSVNGQVHGNYGTEFITRSLKFNLLKEYLLIHVDCTHMNYNFRKELFMASRDRLKQGEEVSQLREYLAKKLQKSQLEEINKLRKSSIGLEGEDTAELIKSFAKNLPKDSDLMKLLSQTLKLEEKKKPTEKKPPSSGHKPTPIPFLPQRFPTYFRVKGKKEDAVTALKLPLNGEKTIQFETDVEDQYFDRTEEPGELKIALISIKRDTKNGGNIPGKKDQVTEVLNVVKSSPNQGCLKITFNPTKELKVGDEVEVKVSLEGAGPTFDELLLIKISDPEGPKEPAPKKDEESLDSIGLPELVRITEEQWPSLEEAGITMDHKKVMYPLGEGDKLDKIYINLDSHVFLSHKSKIKNANEEQIVLSEKRFLSSVYFHTLFLYMITKKRNYKLSIEQNGEDQDITASEYLMDIFDSYYSDFLLNFGIGELMTSLNE